MPPRFVYWTIIFGGQPTSFRSATRDELLPTFKQIQARHPDAQLRYFARGKLWHSEEEERAALTRERLERRPRRDDRPFRGDRPPQGDRPPRPERPRGDRPRDDRPRDDRRPPGGSWKPGPDNRKPHAGRWKPRDDNRKPAGGGGKPRGGDRPQGAGGWRPKPEGRPPGPPDRKPDGGRPDRPWTAKPRSGEGGRSRDWRPGGEHKDPRARFKVPRDVKRSRLAKKFGWKKKDEDK